MHNENRPIKLTCFSINSCTTQYTFGRKNAQIKPRSHTFLGGDYKNMLNYLIRLPLLSLFIIILNQNINFLSTMISCTSGYKYSKFICKYSFAAPLVFKQSAIKKKIGLCCVHFRK